MEEVQQKSSRLKKFGAVTWEVIKAIGYGDLLVRLRMDRALPVILYVFILSMISIFLSYKVEQTMLRRESNKAEIEALKIYKAQKTCEIVSLDRISTVETMLKSLGSEIMQPEKPADILNRK